MNLLKVSITGPESTGKSWLAENLGRHFRASWVPEFSREYLEKLGRPYGFEDIAAIARGQMEREDQAARSAARYLFCDTDLLVTKVWSEFKYGRCDPWILDHLKIHRYDLYLLCDIDLPWQADPLREHPANRKELMEIYQRNLRELKVDYSIINGTGHNRLENAINAILERFEKSNSNLKP